MSKTLIIGGGIAGLSAAVFLSEAGHDVELIEASPKLGGRTSSFQDETTGTEIDNGQHILMGVYKHTFEYLNIINSADSFLFQDSLDVDFIKKDRKIYSIKSPNTFYPFNLLYALLKFDALSWKEKMKVFKFLIKVALNRIKFEEQENVFKFLITQNLSENSIKSLFEIIGVGALNTNLHEASIKVFIDLLKKIFFSGNFASTLVIPKYPLSKIFVDPAIKYFEKKAINYSVSEKVFELKNDSTKISEVITTKRVISNFDKVLLAIPPHSIEKLNSSIPIVNERMSDFDYSPIITLHMWEREKTFTKDFVGFIDSKVHWIFNHGDYVSIVISAADHLINKQKKEIFEEIIKEISEFYPKFTFNNIKYCRIIKERRATIKSNLKNSRIRSKLKSNFENLFIVGDWTNTNLPATIESAVLSSKNILQQI